MRVVVTALLALAGGCVNLSPPSAVECGAGNPACRPPDGNDTDAGRSDGGAEEDRPGAATDTPAVTPTDATSDRLDAAPDRPLDTPVDGAPDLAPDLPPDIAPDIAPDLAPDLAPDAGGAVGCPAESALLVCLRFQGNLVDESAPAATLSSSNVSFEAGIDGLAARLGSSSLLRVNQGWGNISNDLTLEAWVRLDSLPSSGDRAAIFDEETHFGLFVFPGGTVSCFSSGDDATATNALIAGQWSAISCTLQGTSLILSINGVQRDQTTTSASSSATNTLGIGGNLPSGDPFEGLIDNVRVWNRARTAQEICDYAPACP